jgi:tripartite-type tricarboxylate transporter receptor subunit TctC
MAFPARTPSDIVNRISSEMAKIVAMQDVKDTLAANGFTAVSSTPAQFTSFIDAETKKWAKIIKDARIVTE